MIARNGKTQILRQLPGYLLFGVFFLVQSYLIFHETEHAAYGENESCLVCELGQHFDQALPATTFSFIAEPVQIVTAFIAIFFYATRQSFFYSRAPPLKPLA